MDMKRERARRFTDVLGAVDSRYIEEARGYAGSGHARRRSVYTALLAAVLCVAILAGAMIAAKLGEDNDVNIPRYENSFLSAKDIAAQFPVYDSVGTNRYIKIYAPDADSIYADAIPESEYVPVYKNPLYQKELNEREFKKFVENISKQIKTAFGIDFSKEEPYEGSRNRLSLYYDIGVSFSQYSGEYSDAKNSAEIHLENDIVINIEDEAVSMAIDYCQSDEEILAYFEEKGIKDALFEVFDDSFDSVKIKREDRYKSSDICITYYNSQDVLAVGDCIEIKFDSFKEVKDGDNVSMIPRECRIWYRDYRADTDELYYPEAYCERISLEEAEELLLNGYVFANHVCSYCMQQQDLVVFEDYDKVGFEYLKGEDYYIPFYVFFKYLGKEEDGLKIYAKTYVCAIRVPDMDEYMESQTQYHKKIDDVMGSY